MAPPATVKAIVITGRGTAAIQTVPTPSLRPGYVLVRNKAVALNPTDWKHIEWQLGGDPTGARVGCDYAGVVEEVGSGVTKFKKGDRIAGMVHGSNQSNHEDGAFAEWVVAKAALAIKIPDNLTDEQAATLGVGVSTVGQGLYQALGLKLPTEPLTTPEPVLIYGGSSATGLLGIQFAKASGYRVLATASPRNFGLVRSVGADEVFDYHSPACAADIRAATGNRLRLAWDCIASEQTGKLCAAALSDAPDAEDVRYRALLNVPEAPLRAVNPRVSVGFTLAYTAVGEPFEKFMKFPAVPGDLEFATRFWAIAEGLLASGKVRPAPEIVNRGGAGLDGVLVGLKDLKEDKVSGGKLVYTL